MKYAFYTTDIGVLEIGYDGDVVLSLGPVGRKVTELTSEPCELTDLAALQIVEYLMGKRREFDFPYELRGTPFQLAVWERLRKIPYGHTRSYKQIAAEIGNPLASRAVGMANNKNPIFIAVPCHRVIGADGALVGYGGGLGMKMKLLEIERKNLPDF